MSEVGHCTNCCDVMAKEMGKTHIMMGCYHNPMIKHAKQGNCSYGSCEEDYPLSSLLEESIKNLHYDYHCQLMQVGEKIEDTLSDYCNYCGKLPIKEVSE